AGRHHEGEGSFDGYAAHAEIDGRSYTLLHDGAEGGRADHRPSLLLSADGDPIAVIDLQPRPAVDAAQFAQACRRLGIELVLAQNGNATSVTRALAETAGLDVWRGAAEEFVRRAREHGRRVALLTDRGDDAEALALADLSVGLAAGLTEPFV